MDRYEGSHAVQNARLAIIIFAWIFLIVGVVASIIGLTYDYSIDWSILYAGIILIVAGISNCILNAVLKGFEQIVNASETYMEEVRKSKE